MEAKVLRSLFLVQRFKAGFVCPDLVDEPFKVNGYVGTKDDQRYAQIEANSVDFIVPLGNLKGLTNDEDWQADGDSVYLETSHLTMTCNPKVGLVKVGRKEAVAA